MLHDVAVVGGGPVGSTLALSLLSPLWLLIALLGIFAPAVGLKRVRAVPEPEVQPAE